MIEYAQQYVRTPGGQGALLQVRQGTNDANIAISINSFNHEIYDEYRMKDRRLQGWAFDIGAHIGGLAIPMALDNPDLRVVAVEAVPDNADLCRTNAELNGVADRVIVKTNWAAAPGVATGLCHYGYRGPAEASDGYVSAHRFIGGTWGTNGEQADPEHAIDTPAVSIDSLMAEFAIGEVAFIKIDCEGCEWSFLDTPAVARVQTIVGEYHGRPTAISPVQRLRELLPEHDVVAWDETHIDMGLFEATRRG